MLKSGYRQRLYEVALDQYGYVTTDDAARLGIPKVELRKLAQRGGLSHCAWGVYRFDDILVTERDPYMEAVLWAGRDAVLAGESVLALHSLGQVNPKSFSLVTPHRVRRAGRPEIELTRRNLDDSDRTRYFGIPSSTVFRALLDVHHHLAASRFDEAVEAARTEGLLTRAELDALLAAVAVG